MSTAEHTKNFAKCIHCGEWVPPQNEHVMLAKITFDSASKNSNFCFVHTKCFIIMAGEEFMDLLKNKGYTDSKSLFPRCATPLCTNLSDPNFSKFCKDHVVFDPLYDPFYTGPVAANPKLP